MNIYVGNLPNEVSDDELRAAFTEHGQVASAQVIKDRYSGRSRGFGFVEMPNNNEAQAAIMALNGKDFKGRTITVNEAKPRQDRGSGGAPRRSGGGGGGYGPRY
jgi:RNA recognition motif-containing protein